jgi:paraquat-inducible protein B
MRDTQQLVRTVDTKLEPTFTDLQETLKSAQAALENARVALVSIGDTFEGDSTFMFELTRSIRDLQTMAQSVNALADYLQRQPDSLIRGKVSLGR